MPRNIAIEPPDATRPELSISSSKVCYIIVKTREFDAKDVETEIDPASNATDDQMVEVLEDHEDDPVREELIAVIAAAGAPGRLPIEPPPRPRSIPRRAAKKLAQDFFRFWSRLGKLTLKSVDVSQADMAFHVSPPLWKYPEGRPSDCVGRIVQSA